MLSPLHAILSSTLGLAAGTQDATQAILGYAMVKDSTGTGFAANVGGNIVRYTGGDTLLVASNSATTNYKTAPLGTSTTGSPYLAGTVASPSLNSLNIDTSGATGANFLTLNGVVTLTQKAVLMTGANDFTIQGGTQLGAAGSEVIIHNAGTGLLTINSVISSLAGSLAIHESGTVVVGGNNSFTGAVRVNDGVLRLAHANAAGTTAGGITVDNGAALELTGGITIGAEGLTLVGNGVSSGGALRNYAGNNTYQGTITVGAVGARINADTGTTLNVRGITANGNITFGGAGDITHSTTAISGAGAVVKDGAGTLNLNLANTYTGGTTLNGGTVAFVTGALSSSGNITFTGNSTLQWSGVNVQDLSSRLVMSNSVTSTLNTGANDVTFANGIGSSSSGGLTKTGSGKLTITGATTYTGTTTISVGTLQLNLAAANNTTILTDNTTTTTSDIVINGGTLELAASEQIADTGSINMSSGNFNFGAATGKTETIDKFTNSGGVFSTGANTLIGLGATITWSGGTNTINNGGSVQDAHIVISGGTNTVNGGATGGVLQLNASGLGLEMSNGATLTLDSSNSVAGKLLLKGDVTTSGIATVTIASGLGLTNKGNIDLFGGTRTFTVADGTAATDMTIGAVITNGGLTKAGAGTLELTGTHTYTGATTVSNGTLIVNGSISTSTLTTVQTGATLAGTGSVGALTIDTGGSLLPGGIGTSLFTVNGAYTQNGTLGMELNGLTAGADYDQVVVNGGVTLNGDLSLAFNTFTPVNNDMIFILLNGGGDLINGTFTGLVQGAVVGNFLGFDWKISYTGNSDLGSFTGGNDIALMAIPEPGAAFIGSLGMLALLRRRRN